MDVPQWVQILRVYDTVSGTTVDCAKSAHTGQTSHNGYKHWGYKTQYQGLLWTMPSQLTQEERHRRHTMDMNTEGVRHSIRDYRGLYQVSSHRRKGTDVTQWVWTLRFRLCQPLYYGLLLTYQVSSCRCVCIITHGTSYKVILFNKLRHFNFCLWPRQLHTAAAGQQGTVMWLRQWDQEWDPWAL